MKRKQLEAAFFLIDGARLSCDKLGNICQLVLEERKRPPYLDAGELATVVCGCEDLREKLQQAIDYLEGRTV